MPTRCARLLIYLARREVRSALTYTIFTCNCDASKYPPNPHQRKRTWGWELRVHWCSVPGRTTIVRTIVPRQTERAENAISRTGGEEPPLACHRYFYSESSRAMATTARGDPRSRPPRPYSRLKDYHQFQASPIRTSVIVMV